MSATTVDPRDDFEKIFPPPKHVIRCGKGYACTEYNAWGAHNFIRQWEGWSAAMLQGAAGNSPVIPDWQAKAEKMAELHGSSFVLFRNGESPQCADPTKVIISFTYEGLGHVSAAPQQEEE